MVEENQDGGEPLFAVVVAAVVGAVVVWWRWQGEVGEREEEKK